MPRVRLFLVWLLMAAIPLQGWAAATMVFCGGAPQQAPAVHHRGHEGGHQFTADHAVQHVAPDTAPHGDGNHPNGPQAEGVHSCAICAVCCHGVALTDTRLPAGASAAPQADLAEPLVAIHSRPSTVLERPPRA